jgi:hypothetical protein
MVRQTAIAAAILAVGVAITLYNLAGGFELSFPLLLGVLLIVDGGVRLLSLREFSA